MSSTEKETAGPPADLRSVEAQRLRLALYEAAGSPRVCPRCSEGLPDCAHGLPHDEVCSRIKWSNDVCLRCHLDVAVEDALARKSAAGPSSSVRFGVGL